ncbi:MAG: envelope biogenesis factor ElyC [Proteobacteria bacterium]|nr:envelope biogenesis factor ElyC [Pseudomonadota bacterium]
MFLLKKIVSPLLYPLPLCVEILVLGLIVLWFSRKQKTGKLLVSLGVALLVTLSYDAVSNALLRPLEYHYDSPGNFGELSDAKWVVVLGGGHTSDPRVPITGQISDTSLVRLVEGIRLHRALPGSKLILSGGGGFDPVPNAKVMADIALAVGVDRENLILETLSRDTKDEARLIQKMVGGDRFVLVTSASHMPRSVSLFEKLGMKPVPAPTGHHVKERQGMDPAMFFPSADSLKKAEIAFHEYLGSVWAKIRGQV